jgi:hypothetical protein
MSIIYALVGTNRVLIGIQILTIKLLLVISIVFVFLGHPVYPVVCTGCIKKRRPLEIKHIVKI